MKSKSVRHSLMIMFLFIIFILTIVISEVAIYSIRSMSVLASNNYEKAITDGYRTQIKAEVQSIITVLQAEYEKSESGILTEEEAKKEALDLVREMRYGDDEKGYFWIDDTDYNLVMHPILTDQEGSNRYNLKDKQGVMILQEIMKAVNSPEDGVYNKFYFTKEDGETIAPKIAYSQLFKPWNWIVSTGNYTDDLQLQIDNTRNEINRKSKMMLIMIVCVGIFMTIGAVIASRLFGNSICRPLFHIQSLADRISEGDLSTDIEVKEKNEIGQTAKSLNVAQHKMTELVSNIRDTSHILEIVIEEITKNFNSMNKSIQNVSLAVGEITGNITMQANSTSSASDNIEEIVDEVKNTSIEVESLNRNSQIMKDYSVKSMNTLSELIDVNRRTKADIDLMYNQTKSTNESVTKISQAATLISEIADQTNLLSLNASIEAARAGDAGRGFIIVAEEIGELATQSSKTAEEINNIIAELIDNSRKSVEIVKNMNVSSENQVDILNDTKHIFDDLKTALDSCLISIVAIIDKIGNVNTQCQSIIGSINTLNNLAENNAASTQETSAMATDLKTAVEESSDVIKSLSNDMINLSQSMKKFKL